MTGKLTLTTAARFDELLTQPNVTVKNTTIGSEFTTSVYQNGQILAERVVEMRSAEHFEVSLPDPVRESRKTHKLP